ncbi:hypothetical protein AVEN_16381-1 [Araneus ventricosus]|uniref:Uncharacterized protein n=1 Tax=Araneus ventricosus TaxID=182803 RepID=A0A4Y2TZ02_ARAVE|nr:hypothetical protein AVEN_16381-1 [Araneus ventricosus]
MDSGSCWDVVGNCFQGIAYPITTLIHYILEYRLLQIHMKSSFNKTSNTASLAAAHQHSVKFIIRSSTGLAIKKDLEDLWVKKNKTVSPNLVKPEVPPRPDSHPENDDPCW